MNTRTLFATYQSPAGADGAAAGANTDEPAASLDDIAPSLDAEGNVDILSVLPAEDFQDPGDEPQGAFGDDEEEEEAEPKAEHEDEPKAEEDDHEDEDRGDDDNDDETAEREDGDGDQDDLDTEGLLQLAEDGTASVLVATDDGEAALPVEQLLLESGAKFKTKVNGEEVMMTFQELKDGAMMRADYTRKTQEIAAKEDQLVPQAAIVERLKVDPQFQQHIMAFFQNGPDAVLSQKNNNPLQFTDEQIQEKMAEDPDEAKSMLTARKEARERLAIAQRTQQEAQARFSEWAGREREKSEKLILALTPDREYSDISADMISYLSGPEYGFTEEEIVQGTIDSRHAVLAYKAALYDKLQSEKTAPTKALKGKRRKATPPRIIKAGAGKQPQREAQRRGKARAMSRRKAIESGNVDVMVDYLEEHLIPPEGL